MDDADKSKNPAESKKVFVPESDKVKHEFQEELKEVQRLSESGESPPKAVPDDTARPSGRPRQEIDVHAPPAQDEAIQVNFAENNSNNLEKQKLEREKLELEQQLQQQLEINVLQARSLQEKESLVAESNRRMQMLEAENDELKERDVQQQEQALVKQRDLHNKDITIVNITTRLRAYDEQKNEHVKNSRRSVICYAIVCIGLLVAVQDVMDISMQDYILKVAALNSEIIELQNNSEELRTFLEKTESKNTALRMGKQTIQMQLESCKNKIVDSILKVDTLNSEIANVKNNSGQLQTSLKKAKSEKTALKKEKLKMKSELEICKNKITALKKEFPKTCEDARQTEDSSGNMVKIFLLGVERTNVRCDFYTDKGNWLVILRRSDGSADFDRNWIEYVNGFDLETEFWFGLDKLHYLTSSQTYELRIDMENFNGEKRFAKYRKFQIASSSEKYKLTIGEYSGDAGNSIGYHDQKPFTTKDHDNDDEDSGNCAKNYKGGWWFHKCYYCHLTGPYVEDEVVDRYNPGISWNSWKKSDEEFYLLKFVEMKMRPVE
ncbi:uncharacterized protein LOC120346989 [Styela clava]